MFINRKQWGTKMDRLTLAIVGTSKELDDIDKTNIYDIITGELWREPKWTDIITGDASGVDEMVRNMSIMLPGTLTVYKALDKTWDGEWGFKKRNMAIAKQCDELICFTTKTITRKCYHCNLDHQRTGGCWTMKYAKSLGKRTRLYVV